MMQTPSGMLRDEASSQVHAPSQSMNPIESTAVSLDTMALLSTAQVARVLNVSIDSVFRLIARGLLPAHRICRRLRFHPDDLARYLQSTRVQAPTTTSYGRPQAEK